MATYELLLTIKGPAGTATVPATPPTFEAESLKEALGLLAQAELPDNAMIRTIGVSLKRVSDLETSFTPGFKEGGAT